METSANSPDEQGNINLPNLDNAQRKQDRQKERGDGDRRIRSD